MLNGETACETGCSPLPGIVDLSVVIPCLNEERTIGECIQLQQSSLRTHRLTGEVVVADNGSSDRSVEIATAPGARVVHIQAKGYGNALRGGIGAAQGRWILMGDADGSYDFGDIGSFIARLREGYELVMGCRLPSGGGTIKPGAMPWANRWIGNPVLSRLAGRLYECSVHDFHCGLRAFTKEGYRRMGLTTTGMELATEMVVNSKLNGLRITEVPITLYPDRRGRPPHLRRWRDGWFHLRFILLFSPEWLFLLPGVGLLLSGLGTASVLAFGQVKLGTVTLDVHTLAYALLFAQVGLQLLLFALFTRTYAVGAGLLPPTPLYSRMSAITLERGILAGLGIIAAGATCAVSALVSWKSRHFGMFDPSLGLRLVLPSAFLISTGIELIFASFVLRMLRTAPKDKNP